VKFQRNAFGSIERDELASSHVESESTKEESMVCDGVMDKDRRCNGVAKDSELTERWLCTWLIYKTVPLQILVKICTGVRGEDQQHFHGCTLDPIL
jgi:hypothetical protein